jgi:hypothetical protein
MIKTLCDDPAAAARAILAAHEGDVQQALDHLVQRVGDLYFADPETYDRLYPRLADVEQLIYAYGRLGPNPARLRIRAPYRALRDYLPAHAVEREDEDETIVAIPSELAEWTLDRLAGGLIGASLESVGLVAEPGRGN